MCRCFITAVHNFAVSFRAYRGVCILVSLLQLHFAVVLAVSVCHCIFNACVASIHAMMLRPEPEQSGAWLVTGSGSELACAPFLLVLPEAFFVMVEEEASLWLDSLLVAVTDRETEHRDAVSAEKSLFQ